MYIGLFDFVCKVFVKVNGVKSVLFSVNFEGVCLVCNGVGVIYIDLVMMVGVFVMCEVCEGKWF